MVSRGKTLTVSMVDQKLLGGMHSSCRTYYPDTVKWLPLESRNRESRNRCAPSHTLLYKHWIDHLPGMLVGLPPLLDMAESQQSGCLRMSHRAMRYTLLQDGNSSKALS